MIQITKEQRSLFDEIVSKIDQKDYLYRIENGKAELKDIGYYIGDYLIMNYDVEHNRMWLGYHENWLKFSYTYMHYKDNITSITSPMVEEYTKFNGVKTKV